MNAFWNQWRKELDLVSTPAGLRVGASVDSAEAGFPAGLQAEIRRLLAPVQRPCAQISLAGGATCSTQSFLCGHPFLPADAQWPTGVFGPQLFVGQINFAEVPAVPGFPSAGLLQWFIEADPAFGTRRDGEPSAFTIRWYDEPTIRSVPSAYDPDDLTPTESEEQVPMEFVGAMALTFAPAISIPAWSDLPATIQTSDVWHRLGRAFGRRRGDPELIYRHDLRQRQSPLRDLFSTSRIGGHPGCTGDRFGAELIIELDSADTGGWGDGGVAHLLGVPTDLSRGETGAIRYHWETR